MKKIRELDLAHLVARLERATDAKKRRAADSLIQQNIAKQRSPERAIRQIRNHIAFALVHSHARPEQLQAEDPLVHAFIRTQSHPLAGTLFANTFLMQGEVDAAPRLLELVAARPELVWDPALVEADLLASISEHGEHVLDDSVPPWLMHWGPARAGAVLLWFVTLRVFGDLPPKPDPWEKGVYEEAREHAERTKDIQPSSLVAPPPRKRPG